MFPWLQLSPSVTCHFSQVINPIQPRLPGDRGDRGDNPPRCRGEGEVKGGPSNRLCEPRQYPKPRSQQGEVIRAVNSKTQIKQN